MKRTDEMKLGDELHGFCDCNQGRLCCTCCQFAEKAFDRAAKELNDGVNLDEAFADLVGNMPRWHCKICGAADCKWRPSRDAERPGVEIVGTSGPIERFSVAAQLQLMKALAILGWAAFFLELLRV